MVIKVFLSKEVNILIFIIIIINFPNQIFFEKFKVVDLIQYLQFLNFQFLFKELQISNKFDIIKN